MTPEDQLVALAHRRVDDGPLELIRLCLFDWAVCAMAGRSEPLASILADDHSAAGSALRWGAIGHALDYDDTHFDHIGHTSAVIMPTILALGRSASMANALQAALVGSEAAVRVGVWLGRNHYQTGFHQTATAGAFGAVVAGANILGLDDRKARYAIGLAATGASGLKGQFGTMGKPLNAGLAARCGVEAVLWAQAGMTSDVDGLRQFGEVHHGIGHRAAWDQTERWKIARISHKFHACCHGLHAMLEALAGVSGPVESLIVETHPRWLNVCNQQAPDTGLGCKFSYRMAAAMALSGVDTAAIDSFSDACACNPALHAVRDVVRVVANEDLSEMQARVTVRYPGGRSDVLRHDLSRPLDLETRRDRLMQKARAVIGRALADDLWAAAQAEQLAPLKRLVTS